MIENIGRVGRDCFLFYIFFFFLESYHNYQIYLDFAHKILPNLFDYP